MNISYSQRKVKSVNIWFLRAVLLSCCWLSTTMSYGQVQILKRQQPIEIISEYAYWVTSMCEQGCTNIDLGPYKLVTALKDIPQYKRGIVVWAKGDFVLVKDLPTIAGPRANTSMRGQKVVMRKIDVKKHKEVAFVKVAMLDGEKENMANNADFKIHFTFTNPLDRKIKFKLNIAESSTKVVLDANAKKVIAMTIPAAKNKAYINYLIVNENFYLRNFSNSLKVAERTGLVVYLNGSVYPPTLAKK